MDDRVARARHRRGWRAVAAWILIRAEQRWHDRDVPRTASARMQRPDLRAPSRCGPPRRRHRVLLAAASRSRCRAAFRSGSVLELEFDRGSRSNLAVLAAARRSAAWSSSPRRSAAVGARTSHGAADASRAPLPGGRPRPARRPMPCSGRTSRSTAAVDARLRAPPGDRGRSSRYRDGRRDRDALRERRSAVHDAGGARWPWDVAIGIRISRSPTRSPDGLRDDPAVTAATVVRYGQAQIDGRDSYVLAVWIRWHRTGRCRLWAPTLESAPEIALGARSSASCTSTSATRLRLGRRAATSSGGATGAYDPQRLTIVGTAAAPSSATATLGR